MFETSMTTRTPPDTVIQEIEARRRGPVINTCYNEDVRVCRGECVGSSTELRNKF